MDDYSTIHDVAQLAHTTRHGGDLANAMRVWLDLRDDPYRANVAHTLSLAILMRAADDVRRGLVDANLAAEFWSSLPEDRRQSPRGQALMAACHRQLTPRCARCGAGDGVILLDAQVVCASCWRTYANGE